MKNTYIVKYRHGLVGNAMVTALDMDEARREAVSYARFATACIPERYKIDDIVESIEPAVDVPFGTHGYGCRPTIQLETHEDFKRMAMKNKAKNAAKTESLPAQAC